MEYQYDNENAEKIIDNDSEIVNPISNTIFSIFYNIIKISVFLFFILITLLIRVVV